MFQRIRRLLLRRLAQVVPIVVGIVVVNFGVLHLMPGDTVDFLVSQGGAATPEYIAEMRARFGLDRPVWAQLGLYMWNLLRLDLGFSFYHNEPVGALIVERLWPTALLVGTSIALSFGVGAILGTAAARRYGTMRDTLISVIALLFYATPVFWMGLMMIVLFSIKLDLLPTGGMRVIGATYGTFGLALDILHHMIMPVIALSLFHLAVYTRMMRSSMLEVLGLDYIRTARAKGLPENRVAYKHGLRNALLPMVTLLGLQIAGLLGGAVVIETVFAWPGLGALAYHAVAARDFNLLLGILFFSSLLVVAVNLLIDIVYAWLDPRIELR